MQSLGFDLIVYAPYRALEGFVSVMEVSLQISFFRVISFPYSPKINKKKSINFFFPCSHLYSHTWLWSMTTIRAYNLYVYPHFSPPIMIIILHPLGVYRSKWWTTSNATGSLIHYICCFLNKVSVSVNFVTDFFCMTLYINYEYSWTVSTIKMNMALSL